MRSGGLLPATANEHATLSRAFAVSRFRHEIGRDVLLHIGGERCVLTEMVRRTSS